jgi:hypothetical protein
MVVWIADAAVYDSRASAAEPLHGRWERLLSRHVKNGLVDYAGMKADERDLDAYLADLERIDSRTLSRIDQFAFFINAYNAWTVKLIIGPYPEIKSIKDLGGLFGSPWKKKIARIDGALLSLDQIEHEILRPRFKDPRVHFAINCAALSCPPLRPEAYVGERLDLQLDDAARAFINNPDRNYLKLDTLYLSRIFDWFGEDFGKDLPRFVSRYAEGNLKERLAAREGKLRVEFLDYDWGLNGESRSKG